MGESRQGSKFYGTQKEAEAAYLLRFQRYKNKRKVKAQAAPTEKMLEVARRVVHEKLGVKCVDRTGVTIAKNSDGKYAPRKWAVISFKGIFSSPRKRKSRDTQRPDHIQHF